MRIFRTPDIEDSICVTYEDGDGSNCSLVGLLKLKQGGEGIFNQSHSVTKYFWPLPLGFFQLHRCCYCIRYCMIGLLGTQKFKSDFE